MSSQSASFLSDASPTRQASVVKDGGPSLKESGTAASPTPPPLLQQGTTREIEMLDAFTLLHMSRRQKYCKSARVDKSQHSVNDENGDQEDLDVVLHCICMYIGRSSVHMYICM